MGRRALKTSRLFWFAVLVAISFFADAPVRAWVLAHQNPGWLQTGKMISYFGAWPWLMLAGTGFAVVGYLLNNRKVARLVLLAMICSSIAGLLADATRGLTGRTRPNSELTEGWFGVRHDGRWLLGDARYHAFPSGHTAAAAGLVAPFFLARRRFAWTLAPLPIAIAAARIYIGAHHFSDVAAGAALGIAVALFLESSDRAQAFLAEGKHFEADRI